MNQQQPQLENEFDEVADNYDELLLDNIGAFGKDIAYYAEYKVKITNKIVGKANRILEFGCGTGRNIPYFRQYYPNAELWGCDISGESLKIAQQDNPDAQFFRNDMLDELELPTFDLIFMAGVLHHIEPKDRDPILKQIYSLVADQGTMVVFEHNPLNPVTQRAVSTCPFDENAVLLGKGELKSRLKKADFVIDHHKYTLFFPAGFKAFSGLEKFMGWIPMGGQQYIVGHKR